jgi:hypothetical protein
MSHQPDFTSLSQLAAYAKAAGLGGFEKASTGEIIDALSADAARMKALQLQCVADCKHGRECDDLPYLLGYAFTKKLVTGRITEVQKTLEGDSPDAADRRAALKLECVKHFRQELRAKTGTGVPPRPDPK